MNDSLPSVVAVQFGKQLRQVLHQPVPFAGRQGANGGLDLFHPEHTGSLLGNAVGQVRGCLVWISEDEC